jgi:hypothetical protein
MIFCSCWLVFQLAINIRVIRLKPFRIYYSASNLNLVKSGLVLVKPSNVYLWNLLYFFSCRKRTNFLARSYNIWITELFTLRLFHTCSIEVVMQEKNSASEESGLKIADYGKWRGRTKLKIYNTTTCKHFSSYFRPQLRSFFEHNIMKNAYFSKVGNLEIWS